ncbi:MAG: aspartate aminotransferase family protein [Sphingomonadales bacterium]
MTNTALWERRKNVLSPSYKHFYKEPLNIVKGDGVWVFDESGNRYLDCYNNVASVGHCNQNVLKALYSQASTLNTHTRYIHENVVKLGEVLTSKLPSQLDTCFFVCSGSEANDLAYQIAKITTGNHGLIVTESAYHGNSNTIGYSTTDKNKLPNQNWIATIEPPNTYRGPFLEDEVNLGKKYASFLDESLKTLAANEIKPAALLLDPSFDSNGVLIPPEDYCSILSAKIRAAGGLVISDEVQAGYGRFGEKWWGFERYNFTPDIVTMGKPMGDGHPVAAVVTTKEIAKKFAKLDYYFNTFGGNPVSTAVALAVIKEIDTLNLLQNVHLVGLYLKKGLDVLYEKFSFIGNIQGAGLFWGLDLVKDRITREPLTADQLQNITTLLKDEGVLMGFTGRYRNILKIRPPLIFTKENADQAIRALDKVLQVI